MFLLVGLSGCGASPLASEGSGSGTSEGSDAVDDRWPIDLASSEDTGDPPAGDGDDDGAASGYTQGGSGVAEASAGEEESSSGDAPPTDDGDGTNGSAQCTCPGALGFPWAWIANPADGTVTKIDVDSLAVRGRFRTGKLDPPTTTAGGASGTAGGATTTTAAGPVSTSVSIDGRAVAVSNLGGGITKIWADPTRCDDADDSAGVHTSDGETALPWGDDDCVAWHAPFEFRAQIPVAWGAGELDPVTCDYVDQVVWTAGCTGGATGGSTILRLDGDTGMVLDVMTLAAIPCATMGAVDRDGSFWIAGDVEGEGRLAEVTADGALGRIEAAPVIPAGIAVDAAGRVWLSSRAASGSATAARYTPGSRTWDLAQNVIATGDSGIAADATGRMWLTYGSYMNGTAPGGTHIDGAMMQVGPPLTNACPSGGCGGLSIDFAGRVWSTSVADDRVFRFDPTSATVMKIDHMPVSPYGADMTGWALQNAACLGG